MKEWVMVLKAADAAARWHVNQRRKGSAEEPYINHLLEVAVLVAEATEGRGFDEIRPAPLTRPQGHSGGLCEDDVETRAESSGADRAAEEGSDWEIKSRDSTTVKQHLRDGSGTCIRFFT